MSLARLPFLAGMAGRVDLVWHGVNDPTNLDEFLRSPVPWAECDVRRGADGTSVLHHDPIRPEHAPGELLSLEDVVVAVTKAGRSLKVDLKEGGQLSSSVLALLARHPLTDDRLWFNAHYDVLSGTGFRQLREARPHAVRQCPIDFLGPPARSSHHLARAAADELVDNGVDRFSISWGRRDSAALMSLLRLWRFDVNVYGVTNRTEFVRAVRRRPRSVTADFNFPEWDLYGRGSGEGGRLHEARPGLLEKVS